MTAGHNPDLSGSKPVQPEIPIHERCINFLVPVGIETVQCGWSFRGQLCHRTAGGVGDPEVDAFNNHVRRARRRRSRPDSESADAASGCLAKRSVGRVPVFSGTHRHCRPDLLGLDQRPGFHRSDGQRVRAIPQPQKGMAVTIVETRAEIRAITSGVDTPGRLQILRAARPAPTIQIGSRALLDG
jgi:hypothetical protein